MRIINQREMYLENLKRKTRKFWIKIVEDYNSGLNANQIAEKYTNPKTGKKYSPKTIYKIIKEMRRQN